MMAMFIFIVTKVLAVFEPIQINAHDHLAKNWE